jgi:hypothetical protein
VSFLTQAFLYAETGEREVEYQVLVIWFLADMGQNDVPNSWRVALNHRVIEGPFGLLDEVDEEDGLDVTESE